MLALQLFCISQLTSCSQLHSLADTYKGVHRGSQFICEGHKAKQIAQTCRISVYVVALTILCEEPT